MSTQALQGKSPPLPGFLGRGFFLLEAGLGFGMLMLGFGAYSYCES